MPGIKVYRNRDVYDYRHDLDFGIDAGYGGRNRGELLDKLYQLLRKSEHRSVNLTTLEKTTSGMGDPVSLGFLKDIKRDLEEIIDGLELIVD